MDTPETDTGAAFAAGVATATAEQAAQDAATAEVRADIAQADAAAAQQSAAAAIDEAWDARAAVDSLRADFAAFADDIRESLTAGKGGAGGRDDSGTAAPAPERKEESPAASAEPADDGPKPRRAYGSRLWFGN